MDTEFISSGEAAERGGYSTDHVARLCRSGDLECVREERGWTVKKSSLENYLKSAQDEAERRRQTLSETRKAEYKQVSSAEAARMAGYTPDHVARLCRSGELVCVQDDRGWKVDRDSLAAYFAKKEETQEALKKKLSIERRVEYETNTIPLYHLRQQVRRALPLASGVVAAALVFFIVGGMAYLSVREGPGEIVRRAEYLSGNAKQQMLALSISPHSFIEAFSRLFWSDPYVYSPPAIIIPRRGSVVSVPSTAGSSNPSTVIRNVTTAVTYTGVSASEFANRLAALNGRIDQQQAASALEYEGMWQAIRGLSRGQTTGGGGGTTNITNVTNVGGASELSDLSDISLSSLVFGDLLLYDGTNWVNAATSTLGITGSGSSVGEAFALVNGALVPTTTVGIIVSASSTISALSVENGTTTNATSTNLFASNFTLGSLTGFLKATAGKVATSLIDLAADVGSSILAIANGGTGWANIQANSLLLGNGTNRLATTSAGTNGQILSLVSGVPSWVSTTTYSSGLSYSGGNVTNTGLLSLQQTYGTAQTGAITFATSSATLFNGLTISNAITNLAGAFTFAPPAVSGTLTVGGGGTGQSSYTTGDILYASDSTTLTKLGVGGDGTVLKVAGGVPTWGTDNGGSGGSGSSSWATTTSQVPGQLINYSLNATDIVAIGSNATTSAEFWFDPNTGRSVIPFASSTAFTAENLASTSNLVASNSFTFGAFSGFLKATAGVVATSLIDLATDVGSSILAIANGGTGWANIQANSLLLGNGTNRLATTSAGTNGQILSLVSGVPSWVATTTFSTGLTYAAGNVTVNTSQNIATLSNLTTNGFVRTGSGDGTLSVQTDPITLAQGGTATTTFYNGGVLFASSTGSGLLSQSAAAANFFWDETNKRLGLGTVAPDDSLHILKAQNAKTSITIENSTNGTAAQAGLNFITNSTRYFSLGMSSAASTFAGAYPAHSAYLTTDGPTGLSIVADAAAPSIRFYTAGHAASDERLRIDATGNVGIGTTTPQWLLNPTSASASQLALSAGAGTAQWAFRNAGGNLYLATTTVAGTATTSLSALEIAGDGFGTTTVRGLAIAGQATSTSNVGFNLTSGCFGIGGVCLSLPTLSGVLNLATQVGSSILAIANGGTGWANVQANTLLLGNGTNRLATTSAGTNGQILSLVSGVPSWVATTTHSCSSGIDCSFSGGTWSYTNTGVTSVAQTYGSAQTGAITFATSSTAYNGLSSVINITNSSGAFTVNGTLSGTLGVAAGGTGTTTWLNGAVAFYDSTLGTLSQGKAQGDFFFDKANARLGIGTTTPSTKLDVYVTSAASTRESIFKGMVSDSGDDAFFIYNGTSANSTFAPSIGGLVTSATNRVPIQLTGFTTAAGDTGTTAMVQLNTNLTTSATDPANGTLSAVTTRPLFNFTNNAQSQMIILANGNVGIGTTTPFSTLSVSTAAQQSGSLPLFTVASTTASSLFTVLGNGNVGIGTSSPRAPLEVKGAFYLSDTSRTYRWLTAAGYLFLSDISAGGADRLVVTPTGNVGIGTTTVDSLFAVEAADASAAVRISDSTSGHYLKLGHGNTVGVVGTGPGSTLLSVGWSSNQTLNFNSSGNVGIGTTSPDTLLTIGSAVTTAGKIALDGATASQIDIRFQKQGVNKWFAYMPASSDDLRFYDSADRLSLKSGGGIVLSSGLTSAAAGDVLCLNTSTFEVTRDTLPGTTVCGGATSDQRLKENITELSGALDKVLALKPSSFDWKNPSEHGYATSSTGFIAQDLEVLFPELVQEDGCRGLDCALVGGSTVKTIGVGGPEFISYIVKAIQELHAMVVEVKDTVTAFATSFTTKEICVADESGAKTCLTKSQLDALIANANESSAPPPPPAGPPAEEADTEAPVITINGNNPATITVGDTYADQGVSVTDNVGANLGIHTFMNGTEVTTVIIDASVPGEHTITYRATDQAGNTGEAVRTVIVEETSGAGEEPGPETLP